MDFLEYSDVYSEWRGLMTPGRIKMTDQSIIFKNSKTGRVEQINANDIETVHFQRFVGTWGIRLLTKNGSLHRFIGFKDGDNEKVANFFKTQYKKDTLEKELCLKGWNWGTAQFYGSVLSLDMDSKTLFEIPLNHVSQCTPGKNEVTLEFHQNDDAPVGLLEMRFHIPTSESADTDPVNNFYENVLNKASVISVSGDAIAIFREIHCLTPRGRYDIKIFQTFFQLHGKTFDYKIPMSTVLRLFLLPHKDNRQMFFVLSLDPPIKQGQTRYHYLVLLFGNEEEIDITLPFSDEELKEKYDKLSKRLEGPIYEVLGKIMKVLVGRKITGCGNFVGHSGTSAIGCSFKATAGYLYPLERGFIYVHKPPIHIRFEEISSVNFARSGGSTRSFDFEIEIKSGVVHTFSSIEKEEYAKLFDFIQQKKLNVKNTGRNDKSTYKEDFGDSENEGEPDAYLARVKAEAKERDSETEDFGSDEESTDEDFKPNEVESDVADEYDSEVKTSSDESDTEKKKTNDKRAHKAKPTPKQNNKSAFTFWFDENREQIKKDHPKLSASEIDEKAAELWKDVKNKSKWEEKSNKNKSKNSDNDTKDKKKNLKRKKPSNKESPKKSAVNDSQYKSKEYISDSSSDEKSNESDTK